MIVEQGDESWEIEPLSRDGTPVKEFYGADSTTDNFELTKFGYEGDGENINIVKDSPLEDTPNTLKLTTLKLRENPGEDELPVLLNTQYDDRPIRASTPTGVEDGEDTSKLFLYEDSEGVSLVVIHDSPGTEAGGEATFEFDELPEGNWVVEDGPGDIRRTETNEVVNWRWGAEETDGGAYRFDAEEFSFTLTPSFGSGIDAWEFLADDAEAPRRIQLDLSEPVTVRVGGTDRISASATVISYVPGREEDTENNNSAFPDTGNPPLVNPDGFYGDEIKSGNLPPFLDDALAIRKTVSETNISGEFKSYRIKNSLSVSYSATQDGRVDVTEPILVEVNSKEPVNENLLSQPYTTEVSTTDEKLPPTIVHDENYFTALSDTPVPIPVENYSDAQSAPPATNDRYLNVNVAELNNSLGETVQGVRVSTIWGAVNSYIQDVLNTIGEEGQLDIPGNPYDESVSFALPDNPHVYTWIEIALLVDGTQLIRIPDTSVFPRHVLYTNGIKTDTNGFEVSENASDDGYSARYNENRNNVWETFKNEAEGGIVVPYRTPHNIYINDYDNVDNPDQFPGHPVMTYGVDKNGQQIPSEKVENVLGEPLDPFPTGELN